MKERCVFEESGMRSEALGVPKNCVLLCVPSCVRCETWDLGSWVIGRMIIFHVAYMHGRRTVGIRRSQHCLVPHERTDGRMS